MKIYLCGSIRGGRANMSAVYEGLARELKQLGHTLLNPSVVDTALDAGKADADIFRRDMSLLRECDAVVAEVTMPSLGVGYEISSAIWLGKPVYVVAHEDVTVSAIIAGNPHIIGIFRYDNSFIMSGWVGVQLGQLRHQMAQMSAPPKEKTDE